MASGGTEAAERIAPSWTPRASSLLPNYPNPFNPDTWIPFDLARPARVTFTIYGVHGRRVRRIDLGWRDAGSYWTRADAGYWDGANDAGDRVPSGVYICELRAGTYREARKVVVLK